MTLILEYTNYEVFQPVTSAACVSALNHGVSGYLHRSQTSTLGAVLSLLQFGGLVTVNITGLSVAQRSICHITLPPQNDQTLV